MNVLMGLNENFIDRTSNVVMEMIVRLAVRQWATEWVLAAVFFSPFSLLCLLVYISIVELPPATFAFGTPTHPRLQVQSWLPLGTTV